MAIVFSVRLKIMVKSQIIMMISLPLMVVPAIRLNAKARRPAPDQRIEKYSINAGEPVPIKAREAKFPFYVYGDPEKKNSAFVPSGFMGDGQSLKIKSAYEAGPPHSKKSGRVALKITYQAKGKEGWAGVYWLTPANNWGNIKGAGFNLSRAEKLSFWIRGEKGGERLSEVKLGGLTGSYPDSDEASIGPLTLSDQWEHYSIDLRGKDLRHIVGGFMFALRHADNRRGATFYLDEIAYLAPTSGVEDYEVVLSTAAGEGKFSYQEADPQWLESDNTIRKIIPFSTAKTAFSGSSKSELEEVLRLARFYPKSLIVVAGHTDLVGPASTNMKLSRERARAVADYLRAGGINEERIHIIAFGEQKPLVTEAVGSVEERLANNRVEVVLVMEN